MERLSERSGVSGVAVVRAWVRAVGSGTWESVKCASENAACQASRMSVAVSKRSAGLRRRARAKKRVSGSRTWESKRLAAMVTSS